MGGRLLRAWLLRPLVALEPIRDRLDAVEELAFRDDRARQVPRGPRRRCTTSNGSSRARRSASPARAISSALAAVALRDPARAAGARRAAGAARPQPARRSSTTWPTCATTSSARWSTSRRRSARDGGVIRDGVDAELDELRTISRSGKQVIAEMEERERARTGIASLKVRFNRVFGYYIEISKSNLHAVPADYHAQADHRRRRALHHAGAEGVRGEGARRRRAHPRARGRSCSSALRAQVAAEAPRIQDTARALAALDVLAGLAEAGRARQLHQAARARGRRARSSPTGGTRSSSATRATRSCRTTSR